MVDKDKDTDRQDDAPIGMVDGALVEASDDYDDEIGDDESPPAEKTEDRAPRRPVRRIIFHGV